MLIGKRRCLARGLLGHAKDILADVQDAFRTFEGLRPDMERPAYQFAGNGHRVNLCADEPQAKNTFPEPPRDSKVKPDVCGNRFAAAIRVINADEIGKKTDGDKV